MGLFSKSKETADLKQTQEIKDVSTELPTPFMPENLPNLETTQMDQLNQNSIEQNTNSSFNNPFSQNNEQHPQPITQQNINNQPQQNQNNNYNNPLPEPIQQQPNPPINDLMSQPQPIAQQNINNQQTQPEQNSIFNTNQPMQNQPQPTELSKLPSDQSLNTNQPMQNQPTQNQTPQNIIPQEKETYSKDRIQEIVDETVEQVIEERWQQIVEKIEKVAQWKDKQEQHINLIKEDIITMKESFEKLEKRIINKVSDYDKNILDVNSEIKALEKVFQKITPTLVNNVNELSNIAKAFKADSKTENIE
jgi:hypothetical protein